ncbi:helix-turn-helix domain-containing protein [Sagittula sp. S175]|uniref:helix-turn-helix domain-containing protein n=1 Tax=Sagittula sp. S175 TaxID=3415129 RepID=UPI003C7D79CC
MPVYNPVRALDRGLTILQIVNEHDGIRTQEIADRAGLSRPTVFRLLETLQARGFVSQSASSGGWHPTLLCNLLSSGFVDKSRVGQIATPEMMALGREVLWPVDLVTLDGDAMQVRETTHKFSPFSFDLGMVGRRMPILHTAGGHAHIAFCPDDEREVIFDMLRKSGLPENALIHDPRRVAEILDRTRARGFGFRTEGYRNHTHSISFPIMEGARVLATLSVICLKSAISFDDMVRNFAPRLRETCERISKAMAEQDGPFTQ